MKLPHFSFRTKLFLVLVPLLVADAACCVALIRTSARRQTLKHDYSEVNSIKFGLLSVDAWKDRTQEILEDRIDRFEFTRAQQRVVQEEVGKALEALIAEADAMLKKKEGSVGVRLKKAALRTFVDIDELRRKVPSFSKAIVAEIRKPSHTAKLKKLAHQGLEKYADQSYDDPREAKVYRELLASYGVQDAEAFHDKAERERRGLEADMQALAAMLLDSALVFLLAWSLSRGRPEVYGPLFSMSTVFAGLLLLAGLWLPMIDLDARIKLVDFRLWGEHFQFKDQVIFFRSKSILQVVAVMLETGRADSIAVGLLVLAFSVFFPVAKLVSMAAWLHGKKRWRGNRFVEFFAFKSSKWSMADVMVVAIFISYVGFTSILNDQLAGIEVKQPFVEVIATNQTSLQAGYLLFTAFVLFGFALSWLLERIAHIEAWGKAGHGRKVAGRHDGPPAA